jgi:hypothetical protein
MAPLVALVLMEVAVMVITAEKAQELFFGHLKHLALFLVAEQEAKVNLVVVVQDHHQLTAVAAVAAAEDKIQTHQMAEQAVKEALQEVVAEQAQTLE